MIHKVTPERLEPAEHFEGAKLELLSATLEQLEGRDPAMKETSREL